MNSRSSLAAVIGIWCLLIVVTPLLVERIPLIAAFLYLFFSPICHQLPERSFFLFGHQLPVCARCIGIYLGAFSGSFFARKNSPPPWVLVAAVVPMALDGGTQLVFRESTNVLRFVTGLIAGFVVVFYLYAAIASRK